jgi:predicted amidohydrolase YtcJ
MVLPLTGKLMPLPRCCSADERGELALRFYGMLACPTSSPRCSDSASAAGFPLLPRHAASRLTVRTVKLFADGALGSWGSAMWAPYADRPAERGLMLIEPNDLRALVAHWLDAGWQVATHCIGDRANSLVLDAYEALLSARPQQDLRLRVEHAQILRLNDTSRFGQLGVVASMQPTHATSDMGYVEKRLGAERMLGAYPWQSVLR